MAAWREGRLRAQSHYVPRSEKPDGLAGGKVARLDRIGWLSMPKFVHCVSSRLRHQ